MMRAPALRLGLRLKSRERSREQERMRCRMRCKRWILGQGKVEAKGKAASENMVA